MIKYFPQVLFTLPQTPELFSRLRPQREERLRGPQKNNCHVDRCQLAAIARRYTARF